MCLADVIGPVEDSGQRVHCFTLHERSERR
jgi:hypothetical protein